MSSIYIKEPPTSAKVILITTVGEIELELWAKECPKACRNFIQLCLEGYYEKTVFHRLIKNFIVQGGDPTGTGMGGESIYGEPFKSEFHSRLSFNRRGLVGMASPEKNQNGSQFFFTLSHAEELNEKHTLFGKVVGDTLFNMLRLGEVEVGENYRPKRLHKIIKTEVIVNPFEDIVPRKKTEEEEPKVEKPQIKGTKNFTLLSFGDEAEDEEDVSAKVSDKLKLKSKSAHDHAKIGSKLSSEPVDLNEPVNFNQDQDFSVQMSEENWKEMIRNEKRKKVPKVSEEELENIRNEASKLKGAIAKSRKAEMDREDEKRRRIESKDKKDREIESEELKFQEYLQQQEGLKSAQKTATDDMNDFSKFLITTKVKSRNLKKKQINSRENDTLGLLESFKKRLDSVKKDPITDEPDNIGKLSSPLTWMNSKLISAPLPEADAGLGRKVLDPTMDHPDRYDLHDPRNPLNIRKREGMITKK